MNGCSRRNLSSTLAASVLLGLVLAPAAHAQGSDELDAFIEDAMQQGHIPGVAAAIVKGDRVVWAKGYGMANFEYGTPVSVDTPFFLASISKTVTATALMQLRDEGRFALDDDVNDTLAFELVNPFTDIAGLTYRQLLTHTAGLRDNWTVMDPLYVPGDSPWQLQDFHPEYWVRGGQFYDPANNFYDWAPGSAYSYCNQGFSLLGLLGQELAGVPFEDLCEQRVFLPLGMTNSSFRVKDFEREELAMPYGWNSSLGEFIPLGHYGYPDWPAGTLRTSVLDLAKFLRVYINEGTSEGVQLLRASTVEEMLTVQVPAPDPQGLCFYYINTPFTGRVVGHDGGDPGVLTDMYFRPADDTGVILLVNGFGSFTWYWAIYERLWQEADLASTAWHQLGNGVAGTHGQPHLRATGDPVVGEELRLELVGALENAPARLVLGFEGGVASSLTDAFAAANNVALRTDDRGALTVCLPWPAELPAGREVSFQVWVADPTAPFGFAASNAIVGAAP
ncbi:MAG TPA: serine hydrolase domain-containing protein [Planctomycetota bacterium]|nr:serine hydrolase domain-containing protein [Planctomycetota bacterium]